MKLVDYINNIFAGANQIDLDEQKRVCDELAQKGEFRHALIATTDFGHSALMEFNEGSMYIPNALFARVPDSAVSIYDKEAGVVAFPTRELMKWAQRQMLVASVIGLRSEYLSPSPRNSVEP